MGIPAGRYALGISGGADSVSLVVMAARTPGVDVVLVHLNHGLRGAESNDDERFVRDLAARLKLPLVVEHLKNLESIIAALPTNTSAKYRALRLALFKRVIDTHQLDGVLLAHHADDQAETILLRIQRGGGISTMTGMDRDAIVSGVRILRPLLDIRSDTLREYLHSIGQPWREDSSNRSSVYRRNVARQLLRDEPELVTLLLQLSDESRATMDLIHEIAPVLKPQFACEELMNLPPVIARHAARRWLVERGAPVDEISPAVCERLVQQAIDPTSSPRRHYPGKIWVRRRKKQIEVVERDKAN